MPAYLTSAQVAKMLDLDSSTIRRRVLANKYPGAYKPGGGRTSIILVPTLHFTEEQVLEFLKKERAQSGD